MQGTSEDEQWEVLSHFQWGAPFMEWQMTTGVEFLFASSQSFDTTSCTKAIFFVTDPEAPYSWSEEEIADLHDHCTVIMAADGRKI